MSDYNNNPSFIRIPVWYNEADGNFYIVDGAGWKKISGGGTSGNSGFVKFFYQNINLTANSAYVIVHNLNNLNPKITFSDSNGNEIILGILIKDANSVEITSEINLNNIKTTIFG